MATNANAATHGEPLQERNDRFGVAENLVIQTVFIGPEPLAIGKITLGAGVIQFGDITARAKGALPLCINHNQLHRVIAGPIVKRLFNRQTHLVGHRIQRLRTGQGDAARVSGDADVDVAHARGPSAVFQHVAGHDDTHDFVGALKDLMHPQIAHKFLDAIIGQITIAAV